MATIAQERQFIISANGTKTAVIVPLDEYERLLEDLHDLAVVVERKAEGTRSLSVVLSELKKDGLV
jgi:PHD/YefM family antitoxin component YafN of YafNO toxin-antitoxin module